MVLGDIKAIPLMDAIYLSGFLIAFLGFETLMITGVLVTLIEVIIDSIHDKHPIRNQDKCDYYSTKSVVIYNTLPKEGQESIEFLEDNLFEVYVAEQAAQTTKKFSLKFWVKRND